MTSTSATTEGPRAWGQAVSAATAAELVVLGVAMAGGLWPRAIHVPRDVIESAPLPTLKALAAGHAAFLVLVYPFFLWARRDRGRGLGWRQLLPETLGLALMPAPLYLLGAWLADAVAQDVARVALTLAILWPLSLALGQLVGHRWRTAALAVMLGLGVALGACWYVAMEFYASPAAQITRLSPTLYAWQSAASRAGHWLPTPAWPLLCWLGLAVIVRPWKRKTVRPRTVRRNPA